ncbi:MAG: N-sulfoglucosamine sulfohydrolase [Candidatus Promineifilaceae bacterium]|jgi:N-sulfoglucosamine sulfohydrolase
MFSLVLAKHLYVANDQWMRDRFSAARVCSQRRQKSLAPQSGLYMYTLRNIRPMVMLFALGATLAAHAAVEPRPNILWIVSEDNNIQWVGCYGNPNADTPRIDALAAEGFRYTHCFANTPVCAPQRSTWITGVHAVSSGTHPMRSRYAIPHERIPYYADQLRAAGYRSLNPGKTDYNIGGRPDKGAWDAGGVDFNKLKKQQPFFAVVNIGDSHESRAHGDVENTKHSPDAVTLAPYHPDLPDIRKNYAKYQDAVKRMDEKVGVTLDKLAKAGLDSNTIVIYNSDHGGVMARSKRFLVDTGLHCPLVIRIPEMYSTLYPAEKPGESVDRIVSFIDMPRTWLALAGAEIPEAMQGRIFLGPQAGPAREAHFAFRARMDERCDSSRAVRDHRYLYIRNFMPFVPRGQKLEYLWKARATQVWEAYHRAGKTDAVSGRFFTNKPVEELYDTLADPYSINNLAKSGAHKVVMQRMRGQLRDWQLAIRDAGLLPEAEMVKRAKLSKMTIYDMVRDDAIYPLKALLAASDLALEKSPQNRKALEALLRHSDSGLRYWGCVGLFLLGEEGIDAEPALRKALDDESHEVVALTAWALFNLGHKGIARKALKDLLEQHSYAALKVANIIDSIGEGVEAYQVALDNCKPTTEPALSYLSRFQKRIPKAGQ